MRVERGFRRLTLVVSLISGVLGSIFMTIEFMEWSDTWTGMDIAGLSCYVVGFFALPWAIFYFVKYVVVRVVGYIARGFKGEDNSNN